MISYYDEIASGDLRVGDWVQLENDIWEIIQIRRHVNILNFLAQDRAGYKRSWTCTASAPTKRLEEPLEIPL